MTHPDEVQTIKDVVSVLREHTPILRGIRDDVAQTRQDVVILKSAEEARRAEAENEAAMIAKGWRRPGSSGVMSKALAGFLGTIVGIAVLTVKGIIGG